MPKPRIAALLITALLSVKALATGYTGTFPIQGNTGQTLVLQEDAQGNLQGQFTGNGVSFQLQGTVRPSDNLAMGYIYDAQGNPAAYFMLQLQGDVLVFQMGEIDIYGQAIEDPATTRTFTFLKPQAPAAPQNQTPGQTGNLLGQLGMGENQQTQNPQNQTPQTQNPQVQAPQTQAPQNPTGPLDGTEVQLGQIYKGGNSIKVSTMGVGITVPQGWEGTILNQAEKPFLMGSNTDPGLLLVQTLLGADQQTLRRVMEAPQTVDEQTVLTPVGQPVQQGNTLSTEYRDASGQTYAKGTVTTNGTSAVLFFYVSTPQNRQVGERVVQELVRSTRFGQAQLQQVVQKVKQDFSGKKLYNFSFKGGNIHSSSSTSNWFLCSSGQYRFEGSGESSWSVPAGMGGSQSVNQSEGLWQVVALNGEVHLALFPSQGPMKSFMVGHNGKEYTLGGREYTVNPNPLCN